MNEGVRPGWYTDPNDAARTRYWDGTAWTDDVRAASPTVTEQPGDDLAALMGIPEDRTWDGRVRAISLGTLFGVVLLAVVWAVLAAGGDGEDAGSIVGQDGVAETETEVLGSTHTSSTTIPPTTTTTAAAASTSGSEPVSDVIGLPVGEALAALQRVGLAATITEVEDESGDPGTVIAQDPAPGEEVAGLPVTLLVAAAPGPQCNDIGLIPPTTFVDVIVSGSPTDAIAVGWAERANIISGVQPGLFGVDLPLSRAALVSMLHRYFCEPAPEAPSSFGDVAPGSFYADAAAWATGEGIVSGTGDGVFDPDGFITRAQWVTVLWRALGEPAAEADLAFTDVPPGAFYESALRWAVANNLVAGTTPTTFSPEAPLSRLDATTLLYLVESTIDPDLGER